MTKSEFITLIRFAFSDTPNSNMIYREALASNRPGNIIDGNNRMFMLMNQRIGTLSIYDVDNNIVPNTAYTLDPNSGKIVFAVAPVNRLWADYGWLKLTDAEIENAISLAKASGNFDPENVSADIADYAVKYVTAFCYLSAVSHAAEYYTLSASGIQVSKSELFNHFNQMQKTMLDQAKNLRSDQRTDRGDRDIASDAESVYGGVDPYYPTNY